MRVRCRSYSAGTSSRLIPYHQLCHGASVCGSQGELEDLAEQVTVEHVGLICKCSSTGWYYIHMTKRLYRSTDNKMIAGVCGGIAEYFNIDPVIVRIIAVILLLPGGLPGFLPYVVMWITVPQNPKGAASA